MMTPPHLGGHAGVTHIDDGALSYACERWGCQSMLDIGCGPGGMVRHARERGLIATGIDGDPLFSGSPEIITHDFTTGPAPIAREFDLAWSVEFLEHVEPKFLKHIMPAFQACRVAIITHALPGTPGHHHVNCQGWRYWVEVFQKAQFHLLSLVTLDIREASTMDRDFMRRTGLVFKRN